MFTVRANVDVSETKFAVTDLSPVMLTPHVPLPAQLPVHSDRVVPSPGGSGVSVTAAPGTKATPQAVQFVAPGMSRTLGVKGLGVCALTDRTSPGPPPVFSSGVTVLEFATATATSFFLSPFRSPTDRKSTRLNSSHIPLSRM